MSLVLLPLVHCSFAEHFFNDSIELFHFSLDFHLPWVIVAKSLNCLFVLTVQQCSCFFEAPEFVFQVLVFHVRITLFHLAPSALFYFVTLVLFHLAPSALFYFVTLASFHLSPSVLFRFVTLALWHYPLATVCSLPLVTLVEFAFNLFYQLLFAFQICVFSLLCVFLGRLLAVFSH